jgi:hypothetical protein
MKKLNFKLLCIIFSLLISCGKENETIENIQENEII